MTEQSFMPLTVSYAQNREDVIISGFFLDVEQGFYVDVGASDPTIYSVTKLFYDKGWHGINVEPTKELYAKLEQARPRDLNLNFGISDRTGELNFIEYKGHGLSTFSKEVQSDYKKHPGPYSTTEVKRQHKVAVHTLKDIFKDAKVEHIHFLKVDVEGFEYEVLAGNDWSKYRPELICIEANHVMHDWRPLLVKHGYSQVFADGLNEYYLAKESHSRLRMFSYPQTVLSQPVVAAPLYEEIKGYRLRIADLKTEMAEVEASQTFKVFSLNSEIELLRQQIEGQKRVRRQIKTLLKSIDVAIQVHIKDIKKTSSVSKANLRDLTSDELVHNKKKLLANIRRVDLTNYLDRKRLYRKDPTLYLYYVVRSIYMGLRVVAKFVLKGLVRLLKKIRKALKNG